MYIQEPEGGFVSNIKYIRKEELNISELRTIQRFDNHYENFNKKEVRHDRLVFDDDIYDSSKIEYSDLDDRYNYARTDDVFSCREYESINEHGDLNERDESENYSIKSIYDSILNNENDLIEHECYLERHDKKCKHDDYYDDIYAKKEKKCDNKLKFDADCNYKEEHIEDKIEKCDGKKCKEETEIIYKPEKYEKEEYKPVEYEKEEIVYEKPEGKVEEGIELEDFNIIQGEIKAEIEYNFVAIGKFVRKLTPDQICDLHLCVFKYILDSNTKNNQYLIMMKNKMMNGIDDILDLAQDKFKQMYDFYANALNTIGANIVKYSEITKKQIEYKARDILDMINKFTDKLEDLFRKLTMKQIIVVKKLVVNVFMDCYLDKIVGATNNVEKGMSSKVNMNLNWLRRLVETYMDILCENCKKSYYMK